MLQGLVKQIDRDIYYKDNEYHNENGPAIIDYYADGSVRTQLYYINGKLHREDGPAMICILPSLLPSHSSPNISRTYYYLKGKWFSKLKWMRICKPDEYLKKMLEKPHKLMFDGRYEISFISKDLSSITFTRI
jgi:hypothetical protein